MEETAIRVKMSKILETIKDFLPAIADPTTIQKMEKILSNWCAKKSEEGIPKGSIKAKFADKICRVFSQKEKEGDDKNSR